jgi:hypothetical protein
VKPFYRTWEFWSDILGAVGVVILVVAFAMLIIGLTPGKP